MTVGLACRCALAALAVVAALPGSASAAVTLGAGDVSLNTGTLTWCAAPCTFWLRADGTLRPYQAPFDGVVVRWRLQVKYLQLSGGNARLRVVRRTTGLVTNRVAAVRSGRSFPLAAGVNEFADRVPIAAGETVGFDLPGGSEPPFSTEVPLRIQPGSSYGRSLPPLVDGVTQAEGAPISNYELLFNAVVEPDDDHDGFGDESQDRCPSDRAVQGACPPRPSGSTAHDRTGPRFLGGVGVWPRRLLPGGGAELGFALSEPAAVTVALERAAPGRRVRGRCVRPVRRNRGRPKCRRFVRAGVLRTQGHTGKNLLAWTGRVRGRVLAAGSYRAVFEAVDKAGNRAVPRRAGFTVRRLPRRFR